MILINIWFQIVPMNLHSIYSFALWFSRPAKWACFITIHHYHTAGEFTELASARLSVYAMESSEMFGTFENNFTQPNKYIYT